MIEQAMCASFKVGLLKREFDFSSDTTQVFKMALYTEDADLSVSTTAYSSANEASGTGYDAGGKALTIAATPSASGAVAYLSFANVSWADSTITARGALIYLANGTTNPSVAVLDFGSNKSSSSSAFTVQMPVNGPTTSLLRIS